MNIGDWSEFFAIFKKFMAGTSDKIGFLSGFNRILKIFFDIRIFNISLIVWALFMLFVTGLFGAIIKSTRD